LTPHLRFRPLGRTRGSRPRQNQARCHRTSPGRGGMRKGPNGVNCSLDRNSAYQANQCAREPSKNDLSARDPRPRRLRDIDGAKRRSRPVQEARTAVMRGTAGWVQRAAPERWAATIWVACRSNRHLRRAGHRQAAQRLATGWSLIRKSSPKTGGYLFFEFNGNGREFVRNSREWCHNAYLARNRRCGAARIGVI
jgi:hypothetical protein